MPTAEQLAPGTRPAGWLRLLGDSLAVVALGIAAQLLWKPGSPAPFATWVSQLPHGDRLAVGVGFLVAALLVAATHRLARFVRDGDTHAGIVTGLLLVVVVLWDRRSLLPILVLVLVGAEITRRRSRGERGASLATVCVLVFPTAATLLSLVFLDWRLTG